MLTEVIKLGKLSGNSGSKVKLFEQKLGEKLGMEHGNN